MTASEKRSVISLALLYASRMLGLFMVLPVFVLYGQELAGSSEILIGVAIGAYGLSQALFQVPFGALSDRFGRKKLIFFGLLLFLIGSLVAALSTTIYGVIFGRFLQGAGAIASVLMALLSDLTSEESRTKSMAIIGMSIGVSFSVALVIGPLVGSVLGLQGIFWFTAVLALFGMFWLYFFVPNPVQSASDRNTRLFKSQLMDVLKHKELVRLDIGIFALHLCLTALFIAVPMSLLNKINMPGEDHWLVYLTVMVTSFFAMVPFIIIGEKKQKMKPVFLFAILLLLASSLSFSLTQNQFLYFWLSLFFYFMAFNLLEASLPSLVSKICPAGSKGTAMGVYSTCQFFGAFVGGVLGGWVLSSYDESGVYLLVSIVCLGWFLFARGMANPSSETGMTLSFSALADSQAQEITDRLSSVGGVEEVVLVPEDKVAYLKVIKGKLNQQELDSVMECYR
ncbi:MFS transporter [Oleiphilus sp. HI0081]|jgi:MFS family permease|nr:MFS transporter [Oleiphilus sp. HI0061]KZY28300.1 MFS transporter [Oleiphilus sp. HI0043]KZY43441.1 MFS transporter [Oleiphilus sp. HI0050]KZY78261.1 MFS transporter [Oleiphilus sp. HI0068]KZY79607.1 MFS transporter [Oleiphilus sp. HI0069]KZY87923.1 MFS transporter [Oleiphilus sp. HI0072]KZZ22417.1 MFS transporter [Oleiphilus sp. HI0081]KZZ32366.1 MFS transporter [Oleiphilus sp. HI0086]KZZ34698.1 MFS transporter [Oleiphilus sp. HI0117]KZZ60118.1 MFS transporter [Oleiphilus sp. HI0123]K